MAGSAVAAVALAVLVYALVVLLRFRRWGWLLLAATAFGTTAAAVLVEIVLQGYALLHPCYEVVFLKPDRQLGWTQVPSFRYTWTGIAQTAPEFSVPIVTNSDGFRDREWVRPKPAGVVRVALLGDSLVEALQVPFAKTAGQLLERALNADGGAPRYEVVNAGISNFGIGQYLLAWEHRVRPLAPDHVFVYVAEFHMVRTVTKYEVGGFRATRDRRLWVRPVFHLAGDRLELEPARDYAAFVAVQEALIRDEFAGQRIRRRATERFALRLPRLLKTRLRSIDASPGAHRRPVSALPGAPSAPAVPRGAGGSSVDAGTLRVNLRILETLAASVREAGARLVVVDAVEYHNGAQALSDTLRRFCAERGLGYLALSERLLEANRAGAATHWVRDGHFNEAGNAIFAEAMRDWLAPHAMRAATEHALAEDPGARGSVPLHAGSRRR